MLLTRHFFFDSFIYSENNYIVLRWIYGFCLMINFINEDEHLSKYNGFKMNWATKPYRESVNTSRAF